MARKDNHSGSGLLGLVAIAGLFTLMHHERTKTNEERKRIQEEATKRKNTPCMFEDGFTEEEFIRLSTKVCKRIRRVKAFSVKGPVILGAVESQSGISTWEFCVDFNDYGHITGKYWITSENRDSNIPKRIAEQVSELIVASIQSKSTPAQSQDHHDATNEEEKSPDISITRNIHQRSGKKKFHIGLIIISILLFCLVGQFFYNSWLDLKLRPIGFPSSELTGMYYSDVANSLAEAGFTRVTTHGLNDLGYDLLTKDGLVAKVTISGDSTFLATSKYPYDTEIIISYHSPKYVSVPLSRKEAIGMDYKAVKEAFVAAGFGNIIVEPKADLVFGWFAEEGEVDSISIDDDHKYDANSIYRPDAEIRIIYHTYKTDRQ